MSVLTCETVKVVNKALPTGFMKINKTDYDLKVHKLWAPMFPKPVTVVTEEPDMSTNTYPSAKPKTTRRTRKSVK